MSSYGANNLLKTAAAHDLVTRPDARLGNWITLIVIFIFIIIIGVIIIVPSCESFIIVTEMFHYRVSEYG